MATDSDFRPDLVVEIWQYRCKLANFISDEKAALPCRPPEAGQRVRTVFIISVIKDFEEYRLVVRKAVELMDHRPVMNQSFGARPYSSDTACIHEPANAQHSKTSSAPSFTN